MILDETDYANLLDGTVTSIVEEIKSDHVSNNEEIHETIEECDKCPEQTDVVLFNPQKWIELKHIQHIQGHKEFAVYLLGTFTNGNAIVDDYYIPEQEVSAVAADITEEELPPEIASRIIGHLHSHHTMGCSPSQKDIHHLNHPIHIIISDKGNKVTIRKKASCGHIIKTDGRIMFNFPIEIKGMEKIKTRSFQNFGYNNCYNPKKSKKTREVTVFPKCPQTVHTEEDNSWDEKFLKPGMM
jgi:proteasome lid subunit RPN8/RPN11